MTRAFENKKSKAAGVLALILSILFVFGSAQDVHASDGADYLRLINASLAALADGRTQASVDALRQALSCDDADPLGHTALGLTLLLGGYPRQAEAEFDVALKADPACAEAIYAKGMIALDRARFPDAITLICQAQAANPALDMQGTIEYIKALAGARLSGSDSQGHGECCRAMKARALMNEGKLADAAAIWTQLAKDRRCEFGEQPGCSMTFLKSSPLKITGVRLRKAFTSPGVYGKKLPVVSGNVTLEADLTRARAVDMVSFYVDKKFVAATNRSPFSYVWDTTLLPNGAHTITIQGIDADGTSITRKTTQVLVRNRGGGPRVRFTRTDKKLAAWQKLWEELKIKPSAAAVNYNLAKCALASGDTSGAEADLERVLAAEPGYPGAAATLAGIYRSQGSYSRVYRVRTRQKIAVLSFDDGPNPQTPRLLDILRSKGVRATFFIVGKQAEKFPDALKQMAADGDDIENHTYHHRDLELLSRGEIVQEIFADISAIRSITGERTYFLRPPGGHEGKALADVMNEFSMKTIFWTVNCGSEEGKTRQGMLKLALSSARPGAIFLMHNAEPVTMQALPEIINSLRSRGYRFETLREALGG